MEPKITPLLPKYFTIIAIHVHSVCCYSFPTLKKKSFREGSLIDLLLPCPGSTPGQIDPKVNTNVLGHEYFITTKHGKYPSSDSVVKADYVFPYIYIHKCTPFLP